MVETATATCLCEVISAELQKCEQHYTFWLNGKRLRGVTSVIRDVLPPDFSKIPPDVLDKAKHRGIIVDALASAYVIGAPLMIPVDVREDVIEEATELFYKFRAWWDQQHFRDVKSQVTVHDDEVVGAIDILADGVVYDVKCTYNIEPEHHIQVAGYLDLADCGVGDGKLIHVTKRKPVKASNIAPTAYADWETIKEFWRLKRRLGA